jgi:hypothetical protein
MKAYLVGLGKSRFTDLVGFSVESSSCWPTTSYPN